MHCYLFMFIKNHKNPDLNKKNRVEVGALEIEKVKEAICITIHSLNVYFAIVSFVLHFFIHQHILI